MGNILNSNSDKKTSDKSKPDKLTTNKLTTNKVTSNKVTSNKQEIAAFLQKVKQTPKTPTIFKKAKGRLIFAMDATASRQPTWDHACHYQAEMFNATQNSGGLAVQICYYRGYEEFEASAWLNSSKALQQTMAAVFCLGGFTQIHKVLQHALDENKNKKVSAVVFIGDALEEDSQQLLTIAGQLGMLKIPVFIFQEGNDEDASHIFRQIARLSGGAHSHFDPSSASILADLLSAVAVYATGGSTALTEFSKLKSQTIKRLSSQLK